MSAVRIPEGHHHHIRCLIIPKWRPAELIGKAILTEQTREGVMVNDINYLAQLITDDAVPLWLHEYLAQHRSRMIAELGLFGVCEVPTPDGRVMVIRPSTDSL
jgi:hypothetical protein